MKSSITKAEARQVLTQDPVVIWYRNAIKKRFDVLQALNGAGSDERLWEVKGIAQVMRFIDDPTLLLEDLDAEEE
jgi:hypothetical protein